MAPSAGGKRKRVDRSWSGDSGNHDGTRPSPHRPGNLGLAQHQQSQPHGQNRDPPDSRPRGGRRGSRNNNRNSASRRGSETYDSQPRGSPSSAKAMSPPAKESKGPGLTPQPNGTPAPMPSNVSASHPSTNSHKPSYAYEYVTQECLENWTSTGKQTIQGVGKKARTVEDALTLASIFQEIIQSVFEGRLSVTEGGTAVNGIIGEEAPSDHVSPGEGVQTPDKGSYASSLFLDTLSVLTDTDTTRPTLRPFVVATGISPSLMRQQLETPLLQSLGLIRDTFARMGIRKQTNLLYRQSNYNLLREESEGYSKLLTELFTTSNNEPPSSDVVEDTFERVKAMIGAFDMDVGRVLDVTLDVFAAVLVKQYRFFVKLLRASSWWPKEDEVLRRCGGVAESGLPKWALPGSTGWLTTEEDRGEALRRNEERDRVFWDRVREVGIRAFFEIGRKRIADTNNHRKSTTEDEGDETQKWMEETGTLPPKGNRVAAQLLGFKLRFYSSKTRDASDTLPDNLIYLAALLIKIGFISLRDLYPHLWRPDDSMDVLKEEKMQEKVQREKAARPGGGAMNALMMAGALADDTIPFPRAREADTRAATPAKEQEPDKAAAKPEDKDALPEPADQKVLLLKSLLAIGALPESLYILGKFPWLLDAYPELPEYIHRILHHCLSKVAGPLRPAASRTNAKSDKKLPSPDQAGMPKGKVRLGNGPPRRVLRWALLDKEDTNDGTDYRFYWDDWTDNIPICQSVDDVFALCGSLLNLSGVKIGQDPTLLVKLARIGKNSLREDGSEANLARWRDLCKRLLVPSLSLTKANPGVVNEVFELLGNFSREERYKIYAEWYSGQISRLPDVKSAFDQARAETKDALKRLSKTNIRPMARTLAKIAYANPGIVIHVAVSQIESYENLIEVVVECARYFTYLGYDILTWSLINSLGQKGRSRMQESGLLTSRWLNALATFVGRVYKRYCSIMDPVPVLQYVGEQLRQNNSTDLIVLEQLISSMAGIVTDTNFNDAQIQAMAGGDLLRSQTMLQLLDKRHESKTSSKRLMRSLTDSKLAGQLLVAIAQERLTCIFKQSEAEAELKLLGNIFDEIHRVLTQYLDLLRTNFSLEEFESSVPKLGSLIGDFGIQPEVAFWITRSNITHKILLLDQGPQESAAKKTEADTSTTPKISDNDVEMIDEGEATDKENVKNEDVTMTDESLPKSTEPDSETQSSSTPSTAPKGDGAPSWNPVLEELIETIKSVMPQTTWEVVGLPFYVTFWQLSLYDIHVPQRAYEEEMERQKKKVIAIQNDRTDISMAGTQRKEKEKKQINELHDRLLDENKRHLRSYGQCRSRLLKEKDRWFVGMRGKHDSLNIAIMEQCLLPRLLLSPMDAFYCFKMLKYLHSSGTSNFRTLGLLDQLFRDQRLTAIIFQCTSKEADNFGRFLNEVLRDLGRWHADKAVYEKEAYGTKKDLPGFSMAMDLEGKPTAFLDYEDFRRILYKWHRFLSNSLKTCLSGGEYMHIRNAISVLKAIVQQFPAVNWIGKAMHECVNNLKTSDPRDDVKIPAASLIGDLNRREKKWMLPQAFMVVSKPNDSRGGADTPKSEQTGDKASGGKLKTPQPQSRSTTPKPLNATAAEFKPAEAANKVNGDQQGRSETVEDGEIEDAKMIDAPKEENQNPAETTENVRAKPEKLPDTSGGEQSETVKQAAKEGIEKTTPKEAEPPTESKPTNVPSEPRQSVPPSQPQSDAAPSAPRSTSPSQSREDTRTSSEASNQPNIPKRPDVDRHPASSPVNRPPPTLPSKPEPLRPFRHDARGAGRDMSDDRQETRHPDHHRAGRHGAQDRDRAFGHPRVDERGRERDRMEPPRGDRDMPSRPPQEDHYGRPRPSHREQERFDRSTRGRPQPDYFQPRQEPRDEGFHPSRVGNIPPPPDRKDQSREHARGLPHPDNAPPHSQQEPARLDRGDRRYSSRPPTPPRMEDNRPPNRMERRDERDDRRSSNLGPPHPPPPPPPRRDEPPTGPRSDRASRPGSVDGHLPDTRQTHPPSSPDLSYGRLNQEPPGRPQDIPSGPRRGAQGRGGRNVSVSQLNPAPGQYEGSPVRPTDRQPPSGPSNRSRNAPQADQNPPAPSGALPALDTLDTSGIHPDRLKALNLPSSPAPMNPPLGPRSAGYPPTGPSPTSRGPGSASMYPGERGRGDKRFVGINNMLQQSSGMPPDRSSQGASIRGRAGNRQGNTQSSTSSPQSALPQTPLSSKGDSYPGSAAAGSGSPRPDLFSDRSNGPGQEREEPRGSGRAGRRGELIDEAAAESRSSPRNSSSGTRTPDADRDRDRERDRRRDRDRDQDRDRDRDRGGSRRVDDDDSKGAGSKRDDGRDRARDSDRERDRGRARDTSKDRARESRESSSQRDAHSSSAREAPSSGRRRDRRDRDDGHNAAETRSKRGRSPQGHPAPPPPPPPPPPPFPAEERRWSGRNDDRNRDRERERDRDRGRERRDAGPGPGPGPGGQGGGTWPRKRGRPANGGDDGYDQGGMRVGSESKRPRRGR